MIEKPIRILHIFHYMPLCGGAESLIMNYYRHIDRNRVQFDFLLHHRGYYDEEIQALGGRIYYISLKNLPGMIHFFRTHPEYKIIQGHPPGHAPIYFTAAMLCGVPVRISHSHNISTEPTLKGHVLRMIIPLIKYLSNVYWACSTPAGRYMYGERKSFQVIHNAVSTERFCSKMDVRAQMRKLLGINEKFVVGNIGRFCQQKNQFFLLQIFQELKTIKPEAVLLLIGEGELENELRAEVSRLGLEESVQFLMPQTDIENYYQIMDVFVLPSLFEGLPIVLVEAQACEIPCVVSMKVPKESNITGDVIFLPLEASSRTWAEAVVTPPTLKKDVVALLKKKSYDIKYAAVDLVEKYEGLWVTKVIGEKVVM